MKTSIKKYLAGIMFLCAVISCTDLDSELYSELTPETKYTTTDNFLAALLTAYGPLLNSYARDGYWEIQELSTETSAAPAKFGPWDDGGIWARLHRHEWENNAFFINNSWNMCFGGVSVCNRLIEEFQTAGDGLEESISELRALRAFYLFLAMDLYGDIPLVISFADAEANPSRAPRAEVYAYIESELLELIPTLSDEVGGELVGRINSWAARALLARLYLNAEVYTGTAQWQKAANMAQEIIDGGMYSLQPNYLDNFLSNNRASVENIFVAAYAATSGPQFNIHMRTLHPLSKDTYGFTDGPWNGYTALEDFYNSFDDIDNRKNMFIVGQQYNLNGDPIMDPNGAIEIDSEGNPDPDGEPLIFTPYINELTPKAFSQSGARIGKYEILNGLALAMENDVPVFRYSEILLIRAEALWRMNNADAEAVELIRLIRERADLTAIDPLTEDGLYDEIQRELAFEGHARTIMIRFDRFNNPWWEKTITDPNKNLFPIPTDQLNGNPNLVQNPGY